MKNLPQIYCDMDGVLCDFKSYAEKIVGVPIKQWMNLSKVDKWKPIVDKRDFWSTMPWMSGGGCLITRDFLRMGLLFARKGKGVGNRKVGSSYFFNKTIKEIGPKYMALSLSLIHI